jgi:hypothetical protein
LKIAVSVLFVFLTLITSSQVLVNNGNHNVLQENYFNPKFIEQNKISRIVGKVSVKKKLQPINDIGIIKQLSFDDKGALIEKIETFKVGRSNLDTSSILYKYDDVNQLLSQTNYHNQAFDGMVYHYDSSGNLAQKDILRGKNLSEYKYQFEKGSPFLLKTEFYTYEKLNQYEFKKTTFQDKDSPYLETLIKYDSLGNLTAEFSRYTISNKKSSNEYQYNDFSNLIKVVQSSNLMMKVKIEFSYSYDEFGNVYEELKKKNGILIQRRQFLYDPESALLKAELFMNVKTEEIRIVQYEYQFLNTITQSDSK